MILGGCASVSVTDTCTCGRARLDAPRTRPPAIAGCLSRVPALAAVPRNEHAGLHRPRRRYRSIDQCGNIPTAVFIFLAGRVNAVRRSKLFCVPAALSPVCTFTRILVERLGLGVLKFHHKSHSFEGVIAKKKNPLKKIQTN